MSLAGLIIDAIFLLLIIFFFVFSGEYTAKLFIDLLMAGRKKMLLEKILPCQESVLLERARKIMAEIAPIFGVSRFVVVSVVNTVSIGIMTSVFSKDCAIIIDEEEINNFDFNEFELRGAIAHELAHFKRRFGLLSLFSSSFCAIFHIRLSIEEILTDKTAAKYIGKEPVIAVLQKIYMFDVKNGYFGSRIERVKKRLASFGVKMPHT